MKKILMIIVVVIFAFASFSNTYAKTTLSNATSSTGTSSQDGTAEKISDTSSGGTRTVVVRCTGSTGCCWEIDGNGNGTIYDPLVGGGDPPPPPARGVLPGSPIPTILTGTP